MAGHTDAERFVIALLQQKHNRLEDAVTRRTQYYDESTESSPYTQTLDERREAFGRAIQILKAEL